MKYKALNISPELLLKLESGKVKGIDLLHLEKNIPTSTQNNVQHFIFSENISGKLYTYIVTIIVNGLHCTTSVNVTKFNSKLGNDGSYRTYGGGEQLYFSINIENDAFYYLYDIAAIALNNYIIHCMNSL